MTVTSEARHFGLGSAIVASAMPDWLMTSLEKIVLAAVVALLSGFCYAAGTWLWSRIKK